MHASSARIAWGPALNGKGRAVALAAGAGLMVLLALSTARAGDQATAAARSDFFEAKVRPVLVQHCYKCHSARAKSLKGGLRLDTWDGMRNGGDQGPAVVPGNLEESLLVLAVRYTDESLQMPPKGRLPAASIASLEQWVKSGAVGPHKTPGATSAASGTARKPAGIDFKKALEHWAYRPIRKAAVPAVKDRNWPQSPVDFFILKRLEDKGLTPSPEADRRTLLRRVYFDLIGLPPTAEQVAAFENDRAPGAFARVVDRLLASPRYGERWGRHWLDVARFSDTKDGVLLFGDNRVRPYAYTYRDYVVRAFNEDLGFDEFVADQLAADVAAPQDEPWRLAAMGFLTLGKRFDNNIHDQIDDRIDTVTRGFLGLTVACARCHDHKYDAIPTADYYSLYGVFASSQAPLELPLINPSEAHARPNEFEKQAEAKRKAIREFVDAQYKLLSEAARQRTPDYLVRAATTPPDPLETAIFFLSLAPEDLRPQIVARWRRYLKERSRPDDPVFGPWHDLMALPDAAFSQGAAKVLAHWREAPRGTGPGQLNPLVAGMLEHAKLQGRGDVARAYGELFRKADAEARKAAPTISAAADPAREQVAAVLGDHEGPAYFPKSQTYYYLSRGEKDGYGGKLTELDRMTVKAADAWPRAMVLRDAEELRDPRIFVRGNASRPGEHVPRQFLRVLAGADRKPFPHGSGRADLARAITAPDNPLTSRVIVNRIWMHHFGEPLVSTPSDFGTRSTPPSHPELLDHLAARLQENGWSIKSLQRLIVLSSAYRQASLDRPDCRQADPENLLLWHYPRRRLDLEAMRDALLFVSGRLSSKMEGRPVDVAGDPDNRRRTMYGLVDRQSLPAMYRAFDFANPDQSAERRPQTTVPQQALFALNAPFVIKQAQGLAKRAQNAAPARENQIAALYELALARRPNAHEARAAARFLDDDQPNRLQAAASRLSRWEQLAQVVLMTNEFLFVD